MARSSSLWRRTSSSAVTAFEKSDQYLQPMPILEIVTSSGFGSLLGMRHALEPDHLAAVSTLVSRERSGWRAAWLGVCWGVGHSLALLVVGIALVILRAEMPASATNLFELAVAAMLIALGIRAIVQAA